MSTFHFRLATLLRLRETTRDERRLQLVESERADAELQMRLSRVNVEQKRLERERRTAAAPGEVNLPRVIEADQYVSALRAQEAELVRQRAVLAAEIDRRRQALLDADREVQTLENLRQQQSEAQRLEEGRQEGKRLDEAALQTART
jgi:flagellar protein FliJ